MNKKAGQAGIYLATALFTAIGVTVIQNLPTPGDILMLTITAFGCLWAGRKSAQYF